MEKVMAALLGQNVESSNKYPLSTYAGLTQTSMNEHKLGRPVHTLITGMTKGDTCAVWFHLHQGAVVRKVLTGEGPTLRVTVFGQQRREGHSRGKKFRCGGIIHTWAMATLFMTTEGLGSMEKAKTNEFGICMLRTRDFTTNLKYSALFQTRK